MLNLKYIGSEDFYQVSFNANSKSLVTITGDFPVKRAGFKLYKTEGGKPIGDYSSFVTIYKEIENGVMFSNDGSVEPKSKVTFVANIGGYLAGETIQEVYNFEELNVPTIELKENYKFLGWKPEIPESGEIEGNKKFVAMFGYIPTAEDLQMELEAEKEDKINVSKILLADYLERHPLVSDCHNGVEAVYNVTSEKQSLMASNYLTYVIEKQSGIESPVLTWNASGEECEPWTEEEYITLILQIKNYVKPLVSLQQSYEKRINNCTTREELDEIEIIYDVYGISE